MTKKKYSNHHDYLADIILILDQIEMMADQGNNVHIECRNILYKIEEYGRFRYVEGRLDAGFPPLEEENK